MQDNKQMSEQELVDFGWNDIEPKLPKKKSRGIFFFLLFGGLFLATWFGIGQFEKHNSNTTNQKNVDKTNKLEEMPQSELVYEDSIPSDSSLSNDKVFEKNTLQSSNLLTGNKRNNGVKINSTSQYQLTNSNNQIVESNQPKVNQINENKSAFVFIKDTETTIITPAITQREDVVSSNIIQNTSPDVDLVINSAHPRQVDSVNQNKPNLEIENERSRSQYPFLDLHGQTNQFQNLNFGIGIGQFWGFTKKSGLEVSGNFRIGNEQFDQFISQNFIDTTTMVYDKNWSQIQVNVPIKYSFQISDRVKLLGGLSNDFIWVKSGKDSNDSLIDNPTSYTPKDFPNKFHQINATPSVGIEINYRKIKIDLDAEAFGYTFKKSDSILNYQPKNIRLGVTIPLNSKR